MGISHFQATNLAFPNDLSFLRPSKNMLVGGLAKLNCPMTQDIFFFNFFYLSGSSLVYSLRLIQLKTTAVLRKQFKFKCLPAQFCCQSFYTAVYPNADIATVLVCINLKFKSEPLFASGNVI